MIFLLFLSAMFRTKLQFFYFSHKFFYDIIFANLFKDLAAFKDNGAAVAAGYADVRVDASGR